MGSPPGRGPGHLVARLYEVADDRDLPGAARGEEERIGWRMRARHRLHEPDVPVDRASDAEIVALLKACLSTRDRLIVLVMARAGLRRGELCGLRRSDVHLLRRQRVVPLDFLTVQAFDTYEFERMRVARAARSRCRPRAR
ncbi:MAG: recombinase XerD [Actinomycetia bacterium]|nr:recombinase XerD [Actinomycetes bacterium]